MDQVVSVPSDSIPARAANLKERKSLVESIGQLQEQALMLVLAAPLTRREHQQPSPQKRPRYQVTRHPESKSLSKLVRTRSSAENSSYTIQKPKQPKPDSAIPVSKASLRYYLDSKLKLEESRPRSPYEDRVSLNKSTKRLLSPSGSQAAGLAAPRPHKVARRTTSLTQTKLDETRAEKGDQRETSAARRQVGLRVRSNLRTGDSRTSLYATQKSITQSRDQRWLQQEDSEQVDQMKHLPNTRLQSGYSILKKEQSSKLNTDGDSTFYTRTVRLAQPGADIVIRKRPAMTHKSHQKAGVQPSFMDTDDPVTADGRQTEGTKLTLTSASPPVQNGSPRFKDWVRESKNSGKLEQPPSEHNRHPAVPAIPTPQEPCPQAKQVYSTLNETTFSSKGVSWSRDPAKGDSQALLQEEIRQAASRSKLFLSSKIKQRAALFGPTSSPSLGVSPAVTPIKVIRANAAQSLASVDGDINMSLDAERTLELPSHTQKPEELKFSPEVSAEAVPAEVENLPQPQVPVVVVGQPTGLPHIIAEEPEAKIHPRFHSASSSSSSSFESEPTEKKPGEVLKLAIESLFKPLDLKLAQGSSPLKEGCPPEEQKPAIIVAEPESVPNFHFFGKPLNYTPSSKGNLSERSTPGSRRSRSKVFFDKRDFVQGAEVSEDSENQKSIDFCGLKSEIYSQAQPSKSRMSRNMEPTRARDTDSPSPPPKAGFEQIEEKTLINFILQQKMLNERQLEDLQKRNALVLTNVDGFPHDTPDGSQAAHRRLIVDHEPSHSSDSSVFDMNPHHSFSKPAVIAKSNQYVNPKGTFSPPSKVTPYGDDRKVDKGPHVSNLARSYAGGADHPEPGQSSNLQKKPHLWLNIRRSSITQQASIQQKDPIMGSRKSLFFANSTRPPAGLAPESRGRSQLSPTVQDALQSNFGPSCFRESSVNSPSRYEPNLKFERPKLRKATSNITETLLEQSQLIDDQQREINDELEQEEEKHLLVENFLPESRPEEPMTPIQLQVPYRRSNLKRFESNIQRGVGIPSDPLLDET